MSELCFGSGERVIRCGAEAREETKHASDAEFSGMRQLGMQQLVASRDAESALRQEARRKQRAFVAGLREFGWSAV